MKRYQEMKGPILLSGHIQKNVLLHTVIKNLKSNRPFDLYKKALKGDNNTDNNAL